MPEAYLSIRRGSRPSATKSARASPRPQQESVEKCRLVPRCPLHALSADADQLIAEVPPYALGFASRAAREKRHVRVGFDPADLQGIEDPVAAGMGECESAYRRRLAGVVLIELLEPRGAPCRRDRLRGTVGKLEAPLPASGGGSIDRGGRPPRDRPPAPRGEQDRRATADRGRRDGADHGEAGQPAQAARRRR